MTYLFSIERYSIFFWHIFFWVFQGCATYILDKYNNIKKNNFFHFEKKKEINKRLDQKK